MVFPPSLPSESVSSPLGIVSVFVPTIALPASSSAMALLQQVSFPWPAVSIDSMDSMGSSLFQSGGQVLTGSSGERPLQDGGSAIVFQSGATSPLTKSGKKVKIHRRPTAIEKQVGLDLSKRKDPEVEEVEGMWVQLGRKKRASEDYGLNLNEKAVDGEELPTRLEK